MNTAYDLILGEFSQELDSIVELVNLTATPSSGLPKTRIAGANAATLLLAATFEEFVRELAKQFARHVIGSTVNYEDLPPKIPPPCMASIDGGPSEGSS